MTGPLLMTFRWGVSYTKDVGGAMDVTKFDFCLSSSRLLEWIYFSSCWIWLFSCDLALATNFTFNPNAIQFKMDMLQQFFSPSIIMKHNKKNVTMVEIYKDENVTGEIIPTSKVKAHLSWRSFAICTELRFSTLSISSLEIAIRLSLNSCKWLAASGQIPNCIQF